MSEKKETFVMDGKRIVGKDTTEYHEDGSSTTVHQDADYHILMGLHVGHITGITENNPEGVSKNRKP